MSPLMLCDGIEIDHKLLAVVKALWRPAWVVHERPDSVVRIGESGEVVGFCDPKAVPETLQELRVMTARMLHSHRRTPNDSAFPESAPIHEDGTFEVVDWSPDPSGETRR